MANLELIAEERLFPAAEVEAEDLVSYLTPSFIPECLLLVLVYNGIRLFSQRFVFSWDVSNY